MARTFNGSSDYLNAEAASVTVVPLTISCWFKPANITAPGYLAAIAVPGTGTTYEHWALAITGSPNALVASQCASGGSNPTALTANSYTANVWHHACAVLASATSRVAYLNGSAGGVETTNRTPSGTIARTRGGASGLDTADGFFPGDIAELAVWNVAFNDDEVMALARRHSPALVRPSNLVLYRYLFGRQSPEISGRGVIDLTVNGTTVADHPPMIYPAVPMTGKRSAVAATAGRLVNRTPLTSLVGGGLVS